MTKSEEFVLFINIINNTSVISKRLWHLGFALLWRTTGQWTRQTHTQSFVAKVHWKLELLNERQCSIYGAESNALINTSDCVFFLFSYKHLSCIKQVNLQMTTILTKRTCEENAVKYENCSYFTSVVLIICKSVSHNYCMKHSEQDDEQRGPSVQLSLPLPRQRSNALPRTHGAISLAITYACRNPQSSWTMILSTNWHAP